MDMLSEQFNMPGGDNTLAGGGEMGRLMREHDWAHTPLGPFEQWPQSLRTAVSICLASRFPIIIFWGPDLCQFYNDAYRPILGTRKHPSALGQRAEECWAEIWHDIGPMLHGVLESGEATWSENLLLPIARFGFVEECYFTFSYSPIREESGSVGGVFCAVTETTTEVLSERRLRTLRDLSLATAEATTSEEVCHKAAHTILSNPLDLPFALLYLLDADGTRAQLCSAVGLPAGTPLTPKEVFLNAETDVWALGKAVSHPEPVQIDHLSSRISALDGYDDSLVPVPHTALILPISKPGQKTPYGLFIAGLSPRRVLDEDYRGFCSLIAGQIATAIATVRTYAADTATDALSLSEEAPSSFTNAPAPSSARLLVADVNADMRVYLESLLRPYYTVHVASDGYTALELAHQCHPDLLLTDVMMPGLDGFALMAALKADPQLNTIPIILLSARAGEEAVLEGLRLGANDYLVKPFSARELLARIESNLEIVRLRRELAARVSQLEIIFDSITDCLTVYDREGNFVYHNQAVRQLIDMDLAPDYPNQRLEERFSRLSPSDTSGQPIPPKQWPHFRILNGEVLTGNQSVDMQIRTFDGRNLILNISGAPMRDTNGQISGAVLITRDVTERRRAEEERKQMLAQVQAAQAESEAARRRVDAFLGIAGHEMKTPLTSIKGNLQLANHRLTKALQALELDQQSLHKLLTDVLSMLARAEQQVDVQNRFVSDMVDLSRVHSDQLELSMEPADLVSIIQGVVENQRMSAPSRDIRLHLGDRCPILVNVDADRIGQVMINYLTNALKYSPTDRPVDVSLNVEDIWVRVSVHDQGSGISPSEQERIWERFYRVPGIRTQSGSGVGLGLGLYICRMIIQQHGGQVGVDSTPGQGSTFWFTLPLTS
jgi:signal transduction histidine kinase/CheY-like chemotaxis protein